MYQKGIRDIRMLREGSRVTSERPGEKLLPKGLQTGSEPNEGRTGEMAVEDYAMAMVIESSEGLMPMYKEACRCPDWPKWKDVIQKELDNLKKSSTWELVKCPQNANIVENRWVLHIKKNAAGKIEK